MVWFVRFCCAVRFVFEKKSVGGYAPRGGAAHASILLPGAVADGKGVPTEVPGGRFSGERGRRKCNR